MRPIRYISLTTTVIAGIMGTLTLFALAAGIWVFAFSSGLVDHLGEVTEQSGLLGFFFGLFGGLLGMIVAVVLIAATVVSFIACMAAFVPGIVFFIKGYSLQLRQFFNCYIADAIIKMVIVVIPISCISIENGGLLWDEYLYGIGFFLFSLLAADITQLVLCCTKKKELRM